VQVARDQSAETLRFFHQTEAGGEEALNRAIPGASFNWIPVSGSSFTARFRHLLLDGLVLTDLGLDQASYVTLGDRVRDFNIWHSIGTNGAINGGPVRQEDMVLVRPGEGATLRTGAPACIRSFALQRSVAAHVPELELPPPLLAPPDAGRWHMAAPDACARFFTRHQAIMAQLSARPALLDSAAARTGLHNAILDMIVTLGESGRFQPDRAVSGRHTRIMQRFEQIAQEASDEPLGLREICRRTGTSRRSLAAIVLERTGKPPGEYLRWRRLWRARARLSQPEAGTNVTGVAFDLGFWHLGRFTAAYAAAFGERPSRTLARATGLARLQGPSRGLERALTARAV
jgi:AraC-like DNA-binding protein